MEKLNLYVFEGISAEYRCKDKWICKLIFRCIIYIAIYIFIPRNWCILSALASSLSILAAVSCYFWKPKTFLLLFSGK
jgi:hypothetical protein